MRIRSQIVQVQIKLYRVVNNLTALDIIYFRVYFENSKLMFRKKASLGKNHGTLVNSKEFVYKQIIFFVM